MVIISLAAVGRAKKLKKEFLKTAAAQEIKRRIDRAPDRVTFLRNQIESLALFKRFLGGKNPNHLLLKQIDSAISSMREQLKGIN